VRSIERAAGAVKTPAANAVRSSRHARLALVTGDSAGPQTPLRPDMMGYARTGRKHHASIECWL